MARQVYYGMLRLPSGETRALYLLLTPEQAERSRTTMEAETGARWLVLERSKTPKRRRVVPTYTGIPALA